MVKRIEYTEREHHAYGHSESRTKTSAKKKKRILPNTVEWHSYYRSVFPIFKAIWTATRLKQWDDPCVHWRLRSAWASAPSLISLRCPHQGTFAIHWAHSKDSDRTGWMPSWSESSLDAQVILLVWSLNGFHSVLTHITHTSSVTF